MSVQTPLVKPGELQAGTPAVKASAASESRGPSLEYRALYSLVFMICFVIAGLSRLLPRSCHPWICDQDKEHSSLWNEARSAADSTVPYVFQQ